MERQYKIRISNPEQMVRSGKFYPKDVAEIVAKKTHTDVNITPVSHDGDVKVNFDDPKIHEIFSAAVDAAYRAKREITRITNTPDAIKQGVLAEVEHWVDQKVPAPLSVGGQRK